MNNFYFLIQTLINFKITFIEYFILYLNFFLIKYYNNKIKMKYFISVILMLLVSSVAGDEFCDGFYKDESKYKPFASPLKKCEDDVAH